jgi:hypothetical protein
MSRGPKPVGDPLAYQRASFAIHAVKCPDCGDTRSKVLDSRESLDGIEIRRSRICVNRHRFTTRERIKERLEPAEIISGIFLP